MRQNYLQKPPNTVDICLKKLLTIVNDFKLFSIKLNFNTKGTKIFDKLCVFKLRKH
ncbi:hypothetical protein ACFP3I_08390 [Chryseobacterium arachidis]|uniref:hypothetical protein n=1 Tax=Chryseobacterium arachidis TaxID=1416778 RepID=UPI00360FC71F